MNHQQSQEARWTPAAGPAAPPHLARGCTAATAPQAALPRCMTRIGRELQCYTVCSGLRAGFMRSGLAPWNRVCRVGRWRVYRGLHCLAVRPTCAGTRGRDHLVSFFSEKEMSPTSTTCQGESWHSPNNLWNFWKDLRAKHKFCKECCISYSVWKHTSGPRDAKHMPCQLKKFPCKYLDLPLSLKRIRRVEIQPLIDRIAAKLPALKGRILDKVSRVTLVRSVLSSIPIYFLSVFPLQKWALERLTNSEGDSYGRVLRVRREVTILWDGKKALLPKCKGGLGILDLDFFSRALRLRWLWYEWNESARPWVRTTTPCTNIDSKLFRASTIVTIGDGTHAKFWQCCWLNGKAPMDIAPNLYKLAWRKNQMVQQDLTNHSWTRGLWRMNSVDQMTQFITLWDLV